jgi:hypothetical protein
MATITTVSHGSYPQTPRRTYLTSAVFNNSFFQLQKSTNPTTYQDTYTLVAVTGATASNCPQGAYLRETGKKIYPGQYDGINQYYVGVFDDSSFLNGYINPNASIFLPMNTDKPLNIVGDDKFPDGTGFSDNHGPPVYTHGDVLADGNVINLGYISTSQYVHANQFVLADTYLQAKTYLSTGTYANIGTYLSTGTNITAETNISAGKQVFSRTTINNPTITGSGNLTIDASLGATQTVTFSFSGNVTGSSINAINVQPGYTVYLLITLTNTASSGGPFSNNLVLGTNIREQANSAGVAQNLNISVPDNTTYYIIMTFVGIGTDLVEISRQYVTPT